MPTLAAQLTIGDYAKWRSVFDKHKPLRDKAGLTKVRVYRDADNPTELVVWSETSDVAKAREALNGPEIRSAMQEGGVVDARSRFKIETMPTCCSFNWHLLFYRMLRQTVRQRRERYPNLKSTSDNSVARFAKWCAQIAAGSGASCEN